MILPPIQTELQPLLHTDFGSGIPYYDEEFELMQGEAHKKAITKYGPCFEWIEETIGYKYLSDQPIWFFNPQKRKQEAIAGDLVLAKHTDVSKITAEAILFYMEVVSIDDPRRESRDTLEKKPLCEYNGVPEFGLYFPDIKDRRIFEFYRLVNGKYYSVPEDGYGKWCSKTVEGLCIERLSEDEWRDGEKIRIWFENEKLLDLRREMDMRKKAEIAKLEEQKKREVVENKLYDAEIERWEAQQEQKKAEIARLEAEKKVKALAEKLKALGIDPDSL
ncbi:MAG: hypothetical protein H7A23_09200 [Leptospiraceae bacterium]|nr:hypothetical protein [Leptospiraceae bacterium]MCP5494719.1 hypothetical protein [Leptospiraceae bacterium]